MTLTVTVKVESVWSNQKWRQNGDDGGVSEGHVLRLNIVYRADRYNQVLAMECHEPNRIDLLKHAKSGVVRAFQAPSVAAGWQL